jgi:DnaJ-class molecular chaperone
LKYKLAMQLIDIGYKALATKFHPDKGGSRDAMSRLNEVRDRLKQRA